MKPKLILHIGTHKTGTTTLQTLMANHRASLAAQGFCYPTSGLPEVGTPRTDLAKHLLLTRSLIGEPDLFARERDRLLAEFRASGASHLLLSEEGLAAPVVSRADGVEKLRVFAEEFDIQIVCLLRRQDMFAESLWAQRCKLGLTKDHVTKFVHRPNVRNYMTYKPMLDRWATLGAVEAIAYEHAAAEGLVSRFSKAIGATLTPLEDRNVSPSMDCAAMLAALNARGRTKIGWQKVEKLLGPASRGKALGSRLRSEILADFADHNAEMRAAYGVDFPATLPNEPEDPVAVPSLEEIRRIERLLDQKVLKRRG